MIPQLKSIFNKNQWVQIQNWVNGRLTLKQNVFDDSNTATGTTSVTINAKSGVATFTASIAKAGGLNNFTIFNTQILPTSIVSYGLSYSPQETEQPLIMSYACATGEVSFYLVNYSPDWDADLDKVINFQILN